MNREADWFLLVWAYPFTILSLGEKAFTNKYILHAVFITNNVSF